MKTTRRALISVHDKTGIIPFAEGLASLGFEIISTGGTMAAIKKAGIEVKAVSDVTGVPEILGGRVKTLHPAIFGGILAQRKNAEDMETLTSIGIGPVDVVVVNLYPFEETIAKPGVTEAEAIEQIDIGGVSLLRAAGKNFRDVYAVIDPADYDEVLRVLGDPRHADNNGFRHRLAAKVFEHCSAYDFAIGTYLRDIARKPDEATPVPAQLSIRWPLRQTLRYGENPHQAAAFYADPRAKAPSLAHCRQLQGKELSYNNYLDGEAALEMSREFAEPAAVILKHANPCGVGRGEKLSAAYERALKCDPLSAFGGIVGLNRTVDEETAEAMSALFLEVIIAPGFDEGAQAIFAAKKNLRLLEAGPLRPRESEMSYRSVSGGMLAQMTDAMPAAPHSMTVVSKAQPTEGDWDALLFAWKVVRWVRSNAIVYANAERTLGIGAGQMSRIDAAKFGLQKAGDEARGACLASDGFFPFRDVVDLAAKAGVRALIQPGGSVRDDESIAAADEHGLVMIFTGQRHFRH